MRTAYLKASIVDFLEDKGQTLAPSTMWVYRHYLGRFLKSVGDVALMDITPAMVRKVSKKSHPIQAVYGLLNWAVRDARTIVENPVKGMKVPTSGRRSRVVSRLERVRILRRSARPFRDLLVGLTESIARPGELRGVKWGDLRTSASPTFMVQDLVEGRAFFWIQKFKSQKLRKDKSAARVIPVSPRFGRLLARRWRHGRSLDSFVFSNRLRVQWTANAVRCRFRRLRVRGDFTADTNGEQIVAYTLRHSAATEAVQAGLSIFELAALMGHADVRMTQRYVHLAPDQLLDAMMHLDAFRRNKIRKKGRPGSSRKRSDGAS